MANGQSSQSATPPPLELLAANERAIAALYEEYARQHNDKAAFWLALAAAEYRHATWIEELSTPRANADPAHYRFKSEAISSFTHYVRELEEAARRGGIAFATALSLVHYIETALIEHRFFEQLEARGSNAQRVMSALRRETEEHVTKVKEELSRVNPA